MAGVSKFQAELDRALVLLGNLQDEYDALSTEVSLLHWTVNNSLESDKDLKQEAYSTEQINETESVDTMEQYVLFEENEGGDGGLQESKETYNMRPDMMIKKDNKNWMRKAWFDWEFGKWRDPLLRRSEDLRIINLLKVEAGAVGTFGFERNLKQELEYPIGFAFAFKYGGLARSNTDSVGPEPLRDLGLNIKVYQRDRQKGTERDIRASDLRSPG